MERDSHIGIQWHGKVKLCMQETGMHGIGISEHRERYASNRTRFREIGICE